MRGVAQGSSEALLALHERFGASLHRFGLRHLGDAQRADAFVVEVMTRLWRTADRYDADRGVLAGWVFTIARRVAIDGFRRERRRRQVPLSDHEAELTHVDRLDEWLQAELIRTALRRLNPQHRHMIELAYYEQLSQQEIARRTGLPLGTVKSRTYYALRSLRLLCDELGIT